MIPYLCFAPPHSSSSSSSSSSSRMLSCLETKMSYFCLSPLFIIQLYFIYLLVLPHSINCINIYVISTLASNNDNLWLLCPLLTNYNFVLMSCTISWFLNFHVLYLNYEKFNLCLQNTLNMLKTTRVYFGVLQDCSMILPTFISKPFTSTYNSNAQSCFIVETCLEGLKIELKK